VLRASFKTLVGADRYIVGRNANASGGAAMTGSIVLSGAVPAGLATFRAIVEGAYVFNNSVFNYLNGGRLQYSAVVGDGARSGDLYFDPSSGGGLFSVPLSWTQLVHPGDRIDMSFLMQASIDALVGAVELDISNTFRLTAIELPPGYTYTSDADGFLSQFQPPAVPEPASASLMALALALSIGSVLTRRARAGPGRGAAATAAIGCCTRHQNSGGGNALLGGGVGVPPVSWSAWATQPPPIAL